MVREPDAVPFVSPADVRPTFGTHRVCTSCKGKRHAKGDTKLPCRTCEGSGYERIHPLPRKEPHE